MSKSLSIQMLLICLLIVNIQYTKAQDSDTVIRSNATKIHKNVITIDTHDDINVANFTKRVNYKQELSTQVNIPKMKKGGLDVAWFIVYTGQEDLNKSGYEKAYKNAISKFDAIHQLVEKIAPDEIELALNSKDVKRIHASGKKVAMIGVENAYPIGLDLSNIEKFYNLGARYMSLAHQGHSQFSDSNTGEKENKWLYDNGLSDLGRQAIKEMNRLGIMIDISHPSKGAFLEMIKISKAPLIASHSSSRALCNHSRNLDDEQLLLLKENGGVVQTVAFSGYVNIKKNAAYQKSKKDIFEKIAIENDFKILNRQEKNALSKNKLSAYNKKFNTIKNKANPLIKQAEKNTPPVNVSDFADHIDYMVKLIGIDHVGISSDFDGGGGVFGWNDASETFNVTHELVKRGYSENEIAKLWGLNLLRVMDEVQKVAELVSY